MKAPTHVSAAAGGASLLLAWRVKGQTVLVVGGGAVAAGRVRLALEADAAVTVVAPTLTAELRVRHDRGEIEWRARPFEVADLEAAAMVMSAVDDPEVSAAVFTGCRARRIPVNVADVPDQCDFWFTSVHRRGPVQVAVSSNGQGPALAARLTREIGAALPEALEPAVDRFFALRRAVRAADPGPQASAKRMAWLTEVGRTWDYDALANLSEEELERLVADYRAGTPARAAPPPSALPWRGPGGRVALVGAGPGDPDLLTVAAARALAEADVVFADRLIPKAILQLARGELRFARKYPGRAELAQAELNREMVEAATQGRFVVRLKAGDPMVFGRGGEELAFLAEHGVEATVVPGISSALAGPVLAGVPPTHRGLANRLVVMTGQTEAGGWPDIPGYDPNASVVLLMAVGRADRLAAQMIAEGYPEDLPVLVVERAAQPEQHSLRTTLARLGPDIVHHAVRAPAVILVGRVAGFAAEAATPALAVGGDA